MKLPLASLPAIMLLALLTGEATAEDANYVVTGSFHTDSPELSYTPTDFNNQGMVCGYWIRQPEGSPPTDSGVFLWRDGVMRHISPASAGLPFVRAANAGVRMTNVRADGTLLLAAAAVQSTDQTSSYAEIARVIRYTINADLARFPHPVISADALGGYLDPNIGGDKLTELPVDSIFDITAEGYVMGEAASPFVAVPRLLWGPSGGNSPRWFDYALRDQWGVPWAFDHQGTVFGATNHTSFATPLAGLSPLGGTSQSFWPEPAWANPAGTSVASGLYPVAVHGRYRVAVPSLNDNQTAVWTAGFENLTLVPLFTPAVSMGSRNPRNSLTTSGHILGRQISPNAPAIAIRAEDGTYTVRPQHEQLAEGYRLCEWRFEKRMNRAV